MGYAFLKKPLHMYLAITTGRKVIGTKPNKKKNGRENSMLSQVTLLFYQIEP